MANKTHKSASTITPVEEDIEGLDHGLDDDGLGEYPIDTLLIRKETRTVFDVVRRIDNGGFIMNPDFQRDFVWDVSKQSKLIESVVMRIPLPVFYLAENKKGQTIVVDGLQRLSTFQAFLDNKFRLSLPHQESLHKKYFRDIPAKFQNRIEDCNLELYIIDSKVPEQAKLDIFERVNSGEVLTRQQMRNCLFSGPATLWLREEASTDLFRLATGNSLDVNKMRDREFVNRFCSFWLVGVDQYKKDMDEFLAKSLERMNLMSAQELEQLSECFRRGVKNNYTLFGRHAFRKHVRDQDDRNIINASLWDVMSTGMARYPEDVVEEQTDSFKTHFYKLLENQEFSGAITYSPNSTKNVRKRFELAGELFKEVFGD